MVLGGVMAQRRCVEIAFVYAAFPRADGSRTDLAADSAEPPLAGSIHFLVQDVPPPRRHVGQPRFDQLEPFEEAKDIRTAAVRKRGV